MSQVLPTTATHHKKSPQPMERKPLWLKTKMSSGKVFYDIKKDLRRRKLVTVCEEAKCPNIGECWSARTATFMVLGDTCTRACRFCHIKTGHPNGFVPPYEAKEVAESVRAMNLDYVVLTMVDRDDLPDGGAAHVAEVVRAVKEARQGVRVEVLAGDFAGQLSAVHTLIAEGLAVYAHNLETVARLSPRVRDGRARYDTSLRILHEVKQATSHGPIFAKSSLMLGLGETQVEVEETMTDLRSVGCDLLTLGQYMRPTPRHLSVKEWVPPQKFKDYKQLALELGFKGVASHPLARSSYKAKELHALSKRSLESV